MTSERHDPLELIVKSGEAVFAIDSRNRIILWTESCEQMLGFDAPAVLGRYCYDVLGGRDVHGNIHCYENCPIMFQTRSTDEPVRRTNLIVRTAENEPRAIAVSTMTVPQESPTGSLIVHVLTAEPKVVDAPTFDFINQNSRKLHAKLGESGARRGKKSTISNASNRRFEPASSLTSQLTRREQEILLHVAQGLSTRQISDFLCIAPTTVRNHVQSILEKLNVHTKFAAVRLAYQEGLFSEGNRR